MGCFDSNCCVTGLPIHEDDPVKMGLLSSVGDYDHVCYVGDAFQIWAFPVSGLYDSYGSITKIPEADQQYMDTFIDLLRPHLHDHEQYSRKIFEDANKKHSSLSLWNYLACDNIEFDSEYDARQIVAEWVKNGKKEEEKPRGYFWNLKKPVHLRPWMCHEWAWNEVLNLSNFPCTDAEEQMETLFMPNRDQMDDMQRFKLITSEFWYLFGEQAGIHSELKELIADAIEGGQVFTEYFKEKFFETIKFCCKLHLIRKHLAPMTTIGMQHDDFSYMLGWSKLVAKKATELKKKREDRWR